MCIYIYICIHIYIYIYMHIWGLGLRNNEGFKMLQVGNEGYGKEQWKLLSLSP